MSAYTVFPDALRARSPEPHSRLAQVFNWLAVLVLLSLGVLL